MRAGCGYTVLHARVLSIDAAHIHRELSPLCARTAQSRMPAPRRQCAIFASWKTLLAATSVATRPCSRDPLCRGWPLAAVAGALRMPPHPAGGLPAPTASAECVERDRTRGLSQSTMMCRLVPMVILEPVELAWAVQPLRACSAGRLQSHRVPNGERVVPLAVATSALWVAPLVPCN